MPVFVEDPSQLSKARLKSDLIAHNVALPPAHSRKGTYVDLHERHVHQNTHADFSSDEELEADDEVSKEAKILDPSSLTDDGLISALLQHGVKAGPVVASTRAVYERKLRNLLLSNGRGDVTDEANGADEAALYSDSEDDEEEEEEEEEEQEKPVTEEVQTQTEPAEQTLQDTQEPVEEPVQERFKELLADTPTGIYATRRRPIKGAAGRPVQYVYPDIPLSPTTLERQEVERRLVPLHIQILVFFIVAIIIYGIYVFMEDYSFNPLLALIDFLEPGLDSDETGTQAVEEFLEIE
ncbi:unnamed protein product [Knipowitschia caucasica]|uniref:LEM domain-containing protein n=1 Tax=Knipowitschia caucasica TaxID=637954 RepID=A0AAV2M043_KNICA